MNRRKLKQIADHIVDLKGEVDAIWQVEQDRYDNMSERRQGSEKGEAMSAEINALESIVYSLDEAIEHFDGLLGDIR